MGRKIGWLVTASIATVAVATACSTAPPDPTGPDGDATAGTDGGFAFRDGLVCPDQEAGDPAAGGTLTLAMLTEPQAVDPAVNRAPAATGGVEVLAVFEPLMRYDPQTQEYVPQLAEAVEVNDDFTEYTVTLRTDATFSDGSPVDADAVVWSMNRYAETPTAPDGPLWNASVASVTASDERTVVITLNEPWSTFEVMLSIGPGMIVAPSSTDDSLIGAGPFVLEAHTPREDITMTANESYWAGEPPLDGARFIYLGSAQTSVETMESGGAHAAFLRNPDMVEDLFATGDYCGNVGMIAGGSVIQINAGEGRPGADPRVRRAMQLAMDPQVIHDRAFDGKGIASSQLFPEYSKWHTDEQGLPYDPEEAAHLIEEAKADGFDGTVQYVGSASGQDTALAVKAQWEAVGLTVEVDLIRTVPEMIERIMTQQYDAVYWAIGVMESDVYGRVSATLHSGGNQVFGMSTNPERDELIEQFRAASDDAERVELLNQLQAELNQDVPFVTVGALSDVIAWPDNVHGITPGGQGTILLGSAWIDE